MMMPSSCGVRRRKASVPRIACGLQHGPDCLWGSVPLHLWRRRRGGSHTLHYYAVAVDVALESVRQDCCTDAGHSMSSGPRQLCVQPICHNRATASVRYELQPSIKLVCAGAPD